MRHQVPTESNESRLPFLGTVSMQHAGGLARQVPGTLALQLCAAAPSFAQATSYTLASPGAPITLASARLGPQPSEASAKEIRP